MESLPRRSSLTRTIALDLNDHRRESMWIRSVPTRIAVAKLVMVKPDDDILLWETR